MLPPRLAARWAAAQIKDLVAIETYLDYSKHNSFQDYR